MYYFLRLFIILSLVYLQLVASLSSAGELKQRSNLTQSSLLAYGAQQAIIPEEKMTIYNVLNSRTRDSSQNFEADLLKIIYKMEKGNFKSTLTEINALIKLSPNFQLAHLIRGDILLAHTQKINGVGKNSYIETLTKTNRDKILKLQHEVFARFKSYSKNLSDSRLPKQLLQLSPKIKTAIVIDKSSHRLYLYKHQSNNLPPKLINDFYISTGKVQGNKFKKGDLRTPEGVYFITTWIPDNKLPEKYGIGAFPVNYPNELDLKLGKTGYGIWLHGMERNVFSRPPLDSEGCVVLSNTDLKKIQHQLYPGKTPIIITDNIDWLGEKTWLALQDNVMRSINQWRDDWQSMNVEKYLQHYSKDFFTNTHDIKSWKNRKRYLAKSKKYQNIKLSNVSLFLYPSNNTTKNDIVVVRLSQKYDSNNFRGDMEKRMYLRKEGNNWRILYEGK